MVFSTTLHADTYDEYAPYKAKATGDSYDLKDSTACDIFDSLGGDVYDNDDCVRFQGHWISNPLGNNKIDIMWNSTANIEEHEIKENCNGGHSYIWLNAYRNDIAGQRYRIETTYATYTDLVTGTVFNITDGGSCGTDGQPYALYQISGPYKLQVWGNIYPHNGTMPDRRFFWDHTITPNVTAKNKFWQGSGSRTRHVILQEESWWDSINGWVLGIGQTGANSEPTGLNVTYGREQSIAKGLGYTWTSDHHMPSLDKRGTRNHSFLGDTDGNEYVNILDVVHTIKIVKDNLSASNGADCDLTKSMESTDVLCAIDSLLTNTN